MIVVVCSYCYSVVCEMLSCVYVCLWLFLYVVRICCSVMVFGWVVVVFMFDGGVLIWVGVGVWGNLFSFGIYCSICVIDRLFGWCC